MATCSAAAGTGAAFNAPDAAAALRAATSTCRTLQTISAEVSISGRVGGRRLRARMLAGLSAPASAYLDVPAPFGASVFILGATDADATLLLPRDRRVLEHGRPAEVLEALTGVFLDPAALRHTLTGCAPSEGGAGRMLGEQWRLIAGAQDMYVRRETPQAMWRLVAVLHHADGRPGWRAEYRDFEGALPRTVRLTSVDEGRFDLRLALSQVEIDAPLAASTFRVGVPNGFTPITLQELRDAGPLAERESARE